jgi:hypothetical protein
VEIDLLRGGARFLPPAVAMRGDYFVHVSRVGERPKGMVWPIRLAQRLPVLPIPLRPEDKDATLDLQRVLATAYERGRYDIEVDYRGAAEPPLTAEQAAWARAIVEASLPGSSPRTAEH